MAVFGDTECGERKVYVAYLGELTFPQFSKFIAASKKDEVMDLLFLFGLMGQLAEIIQTHQSALVN